jgi:hypothetical protein
MESAIGLYKAELINREKSWTGRAAVERETAAHVPAFRQRPAGVSVSRVKTMLAHVRGEIIDPTMARKAMDDKLSQPHHAAFYRKRAVSIGPVFGNIKANLGFRKFSLRGRDGVHSEWRLICTVHNLLKLQQAVPD